MEKQLHASAHTHIQASSVLGGGLEAVTPVAMGTQVGFLTPLSNKGTRASGEMAGFQSGKYERSWQHPVVPERKCSKKEERKHVTGTKDTSGKAHL